MWISPAFPKVSIFMQRAMSAQILSKAELAELRELIAETT
jgi:hypothetical protein